MCNSKQDTNQAVQKSQSRNRRIQRILETLDNVGTAFPDHVPEPVIILTTEEKNAEDYFWHCFSEGKTFSLDKDLVDEWNKNNPIEKSDKE